MMRELGRLRAFVSALEKAEQAARLLEELDIECAQNEVIDEEWVSARRAARVLAIDIDKLVRGVFREVRDKSKEVMRK